jgi:hypothetical protein
LWMKEEKEFGAGRNEEGIRLWVWIRERKR